MKHFFIFLLIGIVLHLLPNWNIPLHSDVIWEPLIQNSDNTNIKQSVTSDFIALGAYPENIIDNFIHWYQATGRFNVIDLASFRLMAIFAGDDANIWRIFYVLLLSSSVTFFYLMGRRIKIHPDLLILISIGLFLTPLETWTLYKSSEPKAIFFLIIGYYLIFKRGFKYSLLSALSILLAILSKETFIVGLLPIPALIYLRERELQKEVSILKLFPLLAPYLSVLLIFLIFVLYLKLFIPLLNPEYITVSSNLGMNLTDYLVRFTYNLLPPIFSGLWIPVGIISILIIHSFYQDGQISKIIQFYKKEVLFLASILLITSLISVLLIFLAGLNFGGRYILPANYLTAYFFGLIFTPLYIKYSTLCKRNRFYLLFLLLLVAWPAHDYFFSLINISLVIITSLIFSTFKRNVFVFLLIIALSLPYIDQAINSSIKERVDQKKWQEMLTDVLNNSPRNSLVTLKFNDPNMIETAQSLEANTLLQGRYDLVYRLKITDPEKLKESSPFVQYLVNEFNVNRRHVDSSIFVDLTAQRVRICSTTVVTGQPFDEFGLLIKNPSNFFKRRYLSQKCPYLNYQIIVKDHQI